MKWFIFVISNAEKDFTPIHNVNKGKYGFDKETFKHERYDTKELAEKRVAELKKLPFSLEWHYFIMQES